MTLGMAKLLPSFCGAFFSASFTESSSRTSSGRACVALAMANVGGGTPSVSTAANDSTASSTADNCVAKRVSSSGVSDSRASFAT